MSPCRARMDRGLSAPKLPRSLRTALRRGATSYASCDKSAYDRHAEQAEVGDAEVDLVRGRRLGSVARPPRQGTALFQSLGGPSRFVARAAVTPAAGRRRLSARLLHRDARVRVRPR